MRHTKLTLLTLLTLLSALPSLAQDFEFEGIWYTVVDSEALTCGLMGGNPYEPVAGNTIGGDIEIPAKVSFESKEYTVVRVREFSFRNNENLTSVILPETIETIENGAFQECSSLTSINFPNSITSIGEKAFNSCSSLQEAILSENISYIGNRAFEYCPALTRVVLPKKLTYIDEYTFNCCENLQTIVFSEGLEEIGDGAFGSCHAITSLSLPESMISVRGFGNCSGLTFIEFPSSVITIGSGAFEGCGNLKEVVWPSSLEVLGHRSFTGCGLTNVVLPEGVKDIGTEAFNYNVDLESVTIPASLESLGYTAFDQGTDMLLNLTYYAEHPVESGETVFASASHATLYTPNANLDDVLSVYPWKTFSKIVAKDGTYLMPLKNGEDFEFEGIWYTVIDAEAKTCRTKVGDPGANPVIPGNNYVGELMIPASVTHGSEVYSVVEIGNVSFWGNNITSLTIGNSVTTIGWSAFRDCTEMTHVNLPNSLLSTQGDSFQSCLGLKNVVLPESLTTLGGATFSYCRNLESVTIPATLTEFGSDAFVDCNSITEVIYLAETPLDTESGFENAVYENAVLNMPNATLSVVQAINPWRNFQHIIAKDGTIEPGQNAEIDFEYEGIWYTVLDASAKTVKTKDGFADGSSEGIPANKITGELVIPSTVIYNDDQYTVVEIGHTSFQDNYELTSVTLPNTITTIEWDAFYGCSALRDFIIPENVTSVGHGAFYLCLNLESLTLPATLNDVGYWAFLTRGNIKSVNYNASNPVGLNSDIFDSEVYEKAILTMPNATLADIQEVEPWNLFRRISAKDGSVNLVADGDDFVYNGMTYTIIDAEARTCKTKDRWSASSESNPDIFTPDFEIPSTVSNGTYDFTVVEIGQSSFSGCSGLTAIKLPETLNIIGEYAFDSSNLTSIFIPEGVTEIQSYAFRFCDRLTSVHLPESLISIGNDVFQKCKLLEEINFPNNLATIGSGAFYECDMLATVHLPESLRTIGSLAFAADFNVTDISLPEGLLEIGESAFVGCSIKSIILPASLTSIGSAAFGSSQTLEDIYYNASTPIEAPEDVFESAHVDIYRTAILHTPNASLTSVQSTMPWSKFIRIVANDGSVFNLESGEHFKSDGLIYTVIDPVEKTCKTKEGNLYFGTYTPGNEVSGDLIIPNKAILGEDEYTVLEIGEYGFVKQPLTSISLPATVTKIASCAFQDCEGISEITVPEPVSTIGESAFSGCSGLTSAILPSTIATLEDFIFRYCDALSSVTYNATKPVASIWEMFEPVVYENATLNMPNASLEDIRNTEPWMNFLKILAKDGSVGFVTDGDDFEYEGIWYTVKSHDHKTCKTKEGSWNDGEPYAGNSISGDVVIPSVVSDGFDEYTVEEIGTFSFWNNTDMTSVSIPETIIDCLTDAFDQCTGLTKAKFASLEALCNIRFNSNSSNPLYYAHHLYIGDEELTVINFPESLTEIKGYTFTGGSYIATINLHEGVTSIGGAAFHSCSGLTSINLPQSLTTLGDFVFGYCYDLPSIELPDGITEIKDLTFDGCRSLSSITLPSGLTKIGHQAFRNCSSLPSMIIPDGVTSIGAYAFMDCTGLTSVTIPAAVTSFETSAFNGCTGLSAVNYNAATPIEANENLFSSDGDIIYNNAILNTTNATLASVQATVPWNKFKHITASDGSIGLGLNAGDDFEYEGIWYTVIDANAKTVKTKEGGGYNVENDGYICGNNSTGDVTIPSVVSDGTNDYTVTTIGMYSFSNNTELTSISIPESVTSIGVYAFYHCDNLTSAPLHNGIISIGEHAFDWCSNLNYINIPTSLTVLNAHVFAVTGIAEIIIPESVTIIERSAFEKCEKLETVIIPESIEDFGDLTFYNCPLLKSVTYNASALVSGGGMTFSDEIYEKATLYTPNATLESVLSTDPWNKFLRINASDGSLEPEVKAESITISQSTAQLKVGETVTLSVTVLPENTTHQTITWTSSNEEVATVDADGKVTAHALGEATITASCGEVSGSCILSVVATLVESISISQDNAQLTAGESVNLSATVLPEDATDKLVTWTSSNEDVATVDSEGKVTAVSVGEATITASCGNVTATCVVTVIPTLVTGITLNMSSADLKVGDSVTLSATVIPEDATDKTITWSSSNETVATVDADGKVTALSLGESTITARCGNVTATCTIIVGATPATSIELNLSSAELKVGETLSLSAKILPEDATDQIVTWSSSNPTIASVDANGIVTAISLGNTTITATCGDLSATCSVNVLPTAVSSITLSQSAAQLREGESMTLTATVLPEDANDKTVTWTSSNPSVATVDANGNVIAIATGETIITASCGDVTATCSVSVVQTPAESISVSQSAAKLYIGDTLSLSATVLPEEASDKTVIWSSSDNAVASVDDNGNVTAISAGEATVTARCGNVTATCTITVIPNPAGYGDNIESNGIVYTVIDEEARYLSTKEGSLIENSIIPGNTFNGILDIPTTVSDGYYDYTVTEIGSYGFAGSDHLTTVTIPESIRNIGTDAFYDCERLTSLIWKGNRRLQSGVIESIGNPNLLVYVDSIQFAPEGIDHNVVTLISDEGHSICDRLILQQGYAFHPAIDFVSLNSSLTQDYTQSTIIGQSAGWETLVLPFDVSSIYNEKCGELTPFASLSDIYTECPFWLYEGVNEGEWKEAGRILAGVPYIISMPNNPEYLDQYNIDGRVTFSNSEPSKITSEIASPYAVTWASGQNFSSLWLPLDEKQAANAMGLNVGLDDLVGDDGEILPPGSAFHIGVTPRPLEAYVTRQGAKMAKIIMGDQVGVRTMESTNGLDIKAYIGHIIIRSDSDRKVDIFSMEGSHIRSILVRAGKTEIVRDLTKGIYLVAGRKIMVK